MRGFKLISFVGLVISISALWYVGLLYWFPNLPTYLHPIPGVIIIDTILIFGFYHWFWQWKIWYPWLVPFPNLNGTWTGEIYSDWINPKTNKTLDPIPAWLVIRQSFSRIHCTMKTKEMTSESFTAAIEVVKEHHSRVRLIYSYTSQPKSNVVERSRPHWGTMVFEFTQEGSKKLVGEYWTNRKTTGQATFIFADKRKKYDLPNMGKHPAEDILDQVHDSHVGTVINYGHVGTQINHTDTQQDLNINRPKDEGDQ